MRCIRINSGQQRVAVQAIGEANTIRSLASFRQSHEPTANEIVHRHNQIQQMISDDSVGVERQGGLVHYGVEDVFSSKPELANAVYEILGFKTWFNLDKLNNPYFNKLYQSIKTKPKLFSKILIDTDGSYNNDHTIDIHKDLFGEKFEKVYLHEVIHSLTERVFSLKRTSLKEHEIKFVDNIRKLYYNSMVGGFKNFEIRMVNESGDPIFPYKAEFSNNPDAGYPSGLDGNEYYAFTDIREFISEALSNKEFAKYLNSIKYYDYNIEDLIGKNFISNKGNKFKVLSLNLNTGMAQVLINENENKEVYISSVTNHKSIHDFFDNQHKASGSKSILDKIYEYIESFLGEFVKNDSILKEVLDNVSSLINSATNKDLSFLSFLSERKGKFKITPQQKQQALEQYSQYIDSIYPSSTTGLLFKGLRKKGKGHNTPNHSWYSSEYWISDRHYNDGTGVRIFVADTRSLAEHELNTPVGVTPAKQQEEDFINNSYHDAIMLDTEDIGGRQIQYAIRKDIKLHEIGTEQDIEGFRSFIQSQQQEQVEKKQVDPLREKTNTDHNNRVNQRILTSQLTEMLEHYQATFPSLNFIEETNETSGNDKLAWIDNEGVHYNIDKITEETLAHEVSEIFLLLLENTNPDVYSSIIEETKKIVDENETAKRIHDFVEKEYNLTGDRLWNEVAAHIMENDTKLQMEKFLLSKKLGVLSEVPYLVEIIHAAKSFLRGITPFYNKSIRDYLKETIVQQGLSDELLQGLQEPRYKIADRWKRTPTKLNYEVKEGIDVLKRWNHKIADNSNSLKRSATEIAEDIYQKYGIGKEEFQIPHTKIIIDTRNKTHADIIASIMNQYSQTQYGFESRINSSFVDFINKFKTIKDKDKKIELIEKTYNKEMSYPAIYKLMLLMGVRENSDVMLYSDLAYNTEYSHLYDSSFDYKDQLHSIVIINKGKDEKIEVSLFHLTTEHLDSLRDYPYIKNRNLVQNMGKNEYKRKGGTWQNDREGMVKGLLGLQILSLKQKLGKNMILNNGGVITGMGDKTKPPSVFIDFISFMNNMSVIREDLNSNIDLVLNDSLKKILEDDSLFNHENYEDDWVYRYGTYLKEQYEHSADVYNNITAKVAVSKANQLLNESRPYLLKEILIARIRDLNRGLSRNNERELKEIYMLGRAMMQLDRGWASFMNNIKDVGNEEAYMVGLRNFGQDIIQWAVMHGEMGAISWKRRYSELNSQYLELGRAVRKTKSLFSATRGMALLKEVSGEYFEQMYKRGEYGVATKDMVINGRQIKKGDRLMINLPQMYHTDEDVKNGKITKEQKALYDWFVKVANDLIIEVKLHDLQKKNSNATIEDAKREAGTLNPGEIFIITKTANESIFSGDVEGWWNRVSEASGFTDASIEVELDQEQSLKRIQHHARVMNYFNEQIKNRDRIYELMGIKRTVDDNGETVYEIGSEQAYHANQAISTDLQRTIQSFTIEMLRYKAYDDQVIPRLVIAEGMMNFLDMADVNLTFKNTKWLLESAAERAIQRKFPDSGKLKIPTVFGGVDVAKVTRTVLSSAAYSFLALSARVAGRSLGWNISTDVIAAASKSLAHVEGQNDVGGYGISSLLKGSLKTSGDLVKQAIYNAIGAKEQTGELMHLAIKLQTIEGTEASMTSLWRKATGRTRITKQEFAHVGNQLTDIATRLYATVAMLVERGSIDAYVWDPITGTHSYNIKKDQQFFNKDGTQTEAQKFALWGNGGLVERLVEQGQMKLEKGQEISPSSIKLEDIPTGYDDKLIAISLQYYIDKYVMASLGEWEKNLLSSVYLGAAFQQYRVFSFEKLFNMGLFAHNRKTEFGRGMEAVQTPDGIWINRHQRGELEGSYQSLAMTQQAIKYMMQGKFGEWWSSQPEIRRINIMRTMLKTIYAAALIFGVAFAGIPRRDWYKYLWILSDTGMVFMVSDIISSPIPVLGYVQTLSDAITGNRDLTKTLLTHTPLRVGYDPYRMYNEFFTEYEEQ